MNRNTKGISSIAVLLIVVAVILVAGVGYYIIQQSGGQPNINIPLVTQYPYGNIPSPSPAAGPAIENVQGLNSASKELDNVNIDGSMNADLNGLSSDSSSF